jgi:peptide/nickel transport system substrate-binding protein/oligopeptide transport system substrate-binding protein
MFDLFGSHLKKINFIVLAVGFIFVFTCANVDSSTQEKPQYGGEYRVPLEGEPISLDPARFTGIYAMNVAANLFDGLVEFDSNLNVVPAIARVWKISRDHRTYTFRLQRGVKFHNGREVTADDFVYSFSRILNPDTKSPVASMFKHIVGAASFYEGKSETISGLRAKDRYTLMIELKEPFTPFLSILAMIHAKVVPKEAMGEDFGKRPVGTGPFRFRSWQPGHQIVLEANNDYFEGRPFLDILRFSIYPNIEWEKIFKDFEEGLLEQSFIPSGKYNLIMTKGDLKKAELISKPGLNLVYIGMNMTVAPFNDRRVRQAVIYAVDRQKIVKEITKRGSIPAKGIMPPGIAGYDPHVEAYPYDPRKARDLLAEAGYPEGRGLSPIEIWTVSKSESVKNELEAYQRYLAEVGIQLVPKVADNWKEFVKRINDKKAPMFYAAWYADFPDPDNFLYVLCHSKSKTNRMGYRNMDVDSLLEQARGELDYMKRVELYRKIEKIVMQDAPLICQHVNSFNYAFQPWVKGVKMSHMGSIYLPFRKIWISHRQFAEMASR